jgi:hypothetical protein
MTQQSYLCNIVHPSFIKLVHIISHLIKAYCTFHQRRSPPLSTHTSLQVHVPTCTPSPVPRTPSPPAPSRLYSSPLLSTSTLVNSQETLISTIGGNDYKKAVPPWPETPEAPGEFEFESDDKDPVRADQPGLTEEETYFFKYIT